MSYIECGLIIAGLFFSITGLEAIFTKKSDYLLESQYNTKIMGYMFFNGVFALMIMLLIVLYSSDPTTCKYTTTTNTKQIQLQQLPNSKDYFAMNSNKITIFIDNRYQVFKIEDNDIRFIKDNKKIAIIEEKISTPEFTIFKLKENREKCKPKTELIFKEIHY